MGIEEFLFIGYYPRWCGQRKQQSGVWILLSFRPTATSTDRFMVGFEYPEPAGSAIISLLPSVAMAQDW